MTTDIIPGEIADGPAAIRRTVAEARPGARDIAARAQAAATAFLQLHPAPEAAKGVRLSARSAGRK